MAQLTNVQARNASLDLGQDADKLVINTLVVDQLFACMGDGEDVLQVSNSRANRAVLDGGSGVRDQFEELAGNNFRLRQVTNFERITQPRRRV